jgi:hypothetical protein
LLYFFPSVRRASDGSAISGYPNRPKIVYSSAYEASSLNVLV